MNVAAAPSPRARKLRVLLALLFLACGTTAAVHLLCPPEEDRVFSLAPLPSVASAEQVHQFCGACHAYPPPETLPRAEWRKEVKLGYDFFAKSPLMGIDFPPLESVVAYYEQHAPDELPLLPAREARGALPVQFERRAYARPGEKHAPGVSHVQIVRLFGRAQPAILVCDAMREQVLLLRPEDPASPWQVLATGLCCARAEVVDLDQDGIDDIVLAVLGSFYATDYRVGSVVWLRGKRDGTFDPPTVLLENVGRVADVRAGDFNGDGKIDLVVAVFGWRESGEILYLENQAAKGFPPRFVAHRVDERHGAIHVCVADLNHDGKPDFVALISQEHETIVAFLNEGAGRFRKETIYAAPHPAFGSSGIQLVDLDGDGDLDVLFTNGDSLDTPYFLKPYHGVQWLENRGSYPFVPHRLLDQYGASCAVAADLDGDGRCDIVAVSFLAADVYPQRRKLKLPAVTLLMQTAKGMFTPYTLESATCDHLTCAVGDLDGRGRPDLVMGNFIRGYANSDVVTIWKNGGTRGMNHRDTKAQRKPRAP
jgi:hypothetical protein